MASKTMQLAASPPAPIKQEYSYPTPQSSQYSLSPGIAPFREGSISPLYLSSREDEFNPCSPFSEPTEEDTRFNPNPESIDVSALRDGLNKWCEALGNTLRGKIANANALLGQDSREAAEKRNILATRLFQRRRMGRLGKPAWRDRRVEARVVREMYHEKFGIIVDNLNAQLKSIRDHVNDMLANATRIRNIVTTVEDSTKIALFDLDEIAETSETLEADFGFENFQLVYEDQYLVDLCGGIFRDSPCSTGSSPQSTEDGL